MSKMDPETRVFWCQNGEWATVMEPDRRYVECGVFCGEVQFQDLPEYMQREIMEHLPDGSSN